jgi:hypothetical protein
MRKPRPYKGIYYYPDTGRWHYCGISYKSAANVITNLQFLSDEDHAPLMDLKKTPYEPAPKLEDILESAYMEWNASRNTGVTMFSNLFQFTARRIRNAFPHIDEENA